jgi:hypothetical protein
MMIGQSSIQAKILTKPSITPGVYGTLQRACACGQHTSGSGGECEECKKKREGMLQRVAVGSPKFNEVPSIVNEVLHAPGQPLDGATRTFMEPRFGHDFSNVRVHTDATAAESAKAVNALAYTVGNNVVFGAGQYKPLTNSGRKLLAHELTHAVQQSSVESGSKSTLAIANPSDQAEQEAEAVSAVIEQGNAFAVRNTNIPRLARQGETATVPAQSTERSGTAQDSGTCSPSLRGLPPTLGNCSAYSANSWWLPMAYVNNATCACLTTPNSRTANCVRKFLQDRLAATPSWIKVAAAAQKPYDNPLLASYPAYQSFVQAFLTPRIYQDHVDAYANCCCPSGPAPYPSWIGVTTVPIQPCSLVGSSIRHFGSCHGTPGQW